jgi:hypothetical protein
MVVVRPTTARRRVARLNATLNVAVVFRAQVQLERWVHSLLAERRLHEPTGRSGIINYSVESVSASLTHGAGTFSNARTRASPGPIQGVAENKKGDF